MCSLIFSNVKLDKKILLRNPEANGDLRWTSAVGEAQVILEHYMLTIMGSWQYSSLWLITTWIICRYFGRWLRRWSSDEIQLLKIPYLAVRATWLTCLRARLQNKPTRSITLSCVAACVYLIRLRCWDRLYSSVEPSSHQVVFKQFKNRKWMYIQIE